MNHGVRAPYCEIVGEGNPGPNGTLGHGDRAIHLRSTILVHAVEVYTRAFVAELVEYIDHDTVSYGCSDVWYRPLAIDSYDGSLKKAVRVGSDPCDVEIVGDSGCVGEPAKAEHKNAR